MTSGLAFALTKICLIVRMRSRCQRAWKQSVMTGLVVLPVLAVMVTLVMGVSLFALGFLGEKLPADSSWQWQILGCFALFEQMRDFTRGVVDTRTVVLYLSLTLFFLFLTLRIVESRRWK